MINRQERITFINDCDAIVNYGELEKAVLWYTDSPVLKNKHIFMHGKYPAISIHKDKVHIHRLLMMYWLRNKIPDCYFVHHIDENKLNASKENLSLVFAATHQSRHNKGKIISDRQKQRIREFNHSQKGKRRRYKVKVSAKEVFDLRSKGYSFNQISKMLNLDWGCVKRRYDDFIHDNPELLEV